MVSFLNEIHIWSTQDDITIKPNDYGCFKYSIRKENDVYFSVKREYTEKRGKKCVLINKRPHRLRDKLREFEDYLYENKIVSLSRSDDVLHLLLSRGLIVSIKTSSSDIVSINFDKSLLVRVQQDVICDGVFHGSGNQLICSCKDGKILGHGGLKEWCIESGSRKNLSLSGEYLAVWGRTSSENPQPWSPLAKDHHRANLHLYWLGTRGPDLVSYKKTDGEPIKVVVSKRSARSIIVVEQKVSQRGAVSIEVCLFELIGSSLKRASVTSVPLQTQVSCTSLSSNETFLLLGCIDGSVALLDRHRGSTRIVKALFIPTFVAWHDSEAIAAIANERGQIQYYDSALNCLSMQMLSEDVSPSSLLDISDYFSIQHTVESLFWHGKYLYIALEQGPVMVLEQCVTLSFAALIQMFLKSNDLDKAMRLLCSWDFNEQTFYGLQKIVSHLMRLPLTETTAKYLQDALGSFHCPPVPLNADVCHKFGPQVKSMTRRFFHQLVRSRKFETAFLLAVDLGHHDLFMDLHYIAVQIGETEMAAAARAQASSLLSQCSSEASHCSRSSCSQCSDTSSETSDADDSSKIDQPIHLSNENCLSTNFNNPIPKTYKPYYVPPIPNIDLPKIKLPNKNVPPLPSTPPLPTSSTSLTTLGIPFPPVRLNPPFPYNNHNFANRFVPIRTIKARMTQPLRLAPPLPVAPPVIPATPTTSNNTQQPQAKKPQPKVKFSDTVTAFIVPEVKRPVKIPPPAHVTDPQKELADSLPLCHPNEDYLKDFTPISRESNDSPPQVQPKIKVVHFGVV